MTSEADTRQLPLKVVMSALLAILMIVAVPMLLLLFGPASAQGDVSGLVPRTGELSTDDPPVNFRVTGFSDTTAGVAWEVPRDRGITKYVLERFDHDGDAYGSTASWTIDDTTNGGAGHGWANINLESDTLYKYVLMLYDGLDTVVIEASVTVRTSTTNGPTLSNDATLSALSLSGVNIGAFTSGDTYYTATVGDSVMETTVSATTNHSEASYEVKLGGVVDDDGVIPLRVGSNAITVSVTAEDGVTTKIYTINVTREGEFSTDATLSALSLSSIDFGTFSFGHQGLHRPCVRSVRNHGVRHDEPLRGELRDQARRSGRR